MNANLKKMTQEWMQLERKTLKQRQEADSFYEKNLMKLIEQDYQKRNKGKLIGKAEYLIMSVGTSYEPLVLNISLMKPKRILFLYTDISDASQRRRWQRSLNTVTWRQTSMKRVVSTSRTL